MSPTSKAWTNCEPRFNKNLSPWRDKLKPSALPRTKWKGSEIDLNLIVLCGRLATDPEVRVFDSGTRMVRYLVAVRGDHPRRRVDVIPVTQWEPRDDIVENLPVRGARVWVCGSLQRRFWESPDGRNSRLEVVAEQVHTREMAEEDSLEMPA